LRFVPSASGGKTRNLRALGSARTAKRRRPAVRWRGARLRCRKQARKAASKRASSCWV